MAAIPRNMTGMAIKMSAAGYKTHMFGKWDAGMATVDHTPHGRGYQTSLHYFHHACVALSRQRVRALASPLVLPWPDLIWWWHMQERLLDLDDRQLLDFS